MAVYVGKLRGQVRFLYGRVTPPPPMFGLSADSQDELVASHYTLTEGQRDRAVQIGAQVISARRADRMERQRAAIRGES